MHRYSETYDPATLKWHHITQEPDETGFGVDYEYTILGYDLASGRLDMMMRFASASHNCERHGHVASTTTLILEGEQHLDEHHPDGTITKVVRKKGAYALASTDATPHTERGGPEGCTLLLSLHAPDGILFRAFGPDFKESLDVSIQDFVARWADWLESPVK